MNKSDFVQIQAEHYDRIADEYAVHYGDFYSQQYRNRFINKHLTEGLELKNLSALEAMCGSGETTRYLIEQGAIVTGLDVSEKEITKFKNRWPEAKGICSSIFDSKIPDASFDFLVVVGGLHHLHPDLNSAIIEMHRILKPKGYFCFAEPHAGSVMDTLRRIWYRHDKLFEVNEEAIDLKSLKKTFTDKFEFKREVYIGGPAYLFVLNSMVFRVPLFIKKIYSPILLILDGIIEKFQGARTSCMVVAQWQKK